MVQDLVQEPAICHEPRSGPSTFSRLPLIETVIIRLLSASDYLLLTDVQRELRLVGQHKSISDASLSDMGRQAHHWTARHRMGT